jgi:hypothetical protein
VKIKSLKMKKTVFWIFALIFVALSSCNDEPIKGDFGETTPIGPSNFEVLIDGEQFTGSQNAVTTIQRRTTIIGLSENGNSVNMVVDGAGEGTYQIENTENSTAVYFEPDNDLPYNFINLDTLGTVSITNYDDAAGIASGTFDFAAVKTVVDTAGDQTVDTLNFTQGRFENIPLNTDGTQPTDPTAPTGDFKVKLDGDQYMGSENESVLNSFGLQIKASNLDEKSFSIQIAGNVQEGNTYDLNSEDNSGDIIFKYFPDATNQNQAFKAVSGNLSITGIDNANRLISGTFSGTLQQDGSGSQIEMTEGNFELPYSTQISGNIASAKVNGEDFEASTFFAQKIAGQYILKFKNEDDTQFTLYLPENLENGIYDAEIPQQNYSGIYQTTEGGTQIFNSVAGSGNFVILSSINQTVTGSFDFEAQTGSGESVSITQGSFTFQLP